MYSSGPNVLHLRSYDVLHFVVGILILLVGIGALIFLARAAGGVSFGHGQSYCIYFPFRPGGLYEGTEVVFRTGRIGQITAISEAKKPSRESRDSDPTAITFQIDRKFLSTNMPVMSRKHTKIVIDTNLLSGVSALNITGASSNDLTEPGDRMPPLDPGKEVCDYDVSAKNFRFGSGGTAGTAGNAQYSYANQFLFYAAQYARRGQGKGLIDLVDTESHDIGNLLHNLNEIAASAKNDGVLALLRDRDQRPVEAATDALNTVRDGVRRLTELIGEAGPTGSGLGGSGLGGSGKRVTVAATLDDLDQVIKELKETNRQLQRRLKELDPGLQQTVGGAQGLVAEVRQLVNGLNLLTRQIERDPSRFLFGDRREGYRSR